MSADPSNWNIIDRGTFLAVEARQGGAVGPCGDNSGTNPRSRNPQQNALTSAYDERRQIGVGV